LTRKKPDAQKKKKAGRAGKRGRPRRRPGEDEPHRDSRVDLWGYLPGIPREKENDASLVSSSAFADDTEKARPKNYTSSAQQLRRYLLVTSDGRTEKGVTPSANRESELEVL